VAGLILFRLVAFWEIPASLLRAPHLCQLEFDDRQESALGLTQHGHSLTTMFRTYAAWVRGATDADVAIIQSAMNSERSAADSGPSQESRSAGSSGEIGHSIGHWSCKLPRLN
jgi:hypothetical protein